MGIGTVSLHTREVGLVGVGREAASRDPMLGYAGWEAGWWISLVLGRRRVGEWWRRRSKADEVAGRQQSLCRGHSCGSRYVEIMGREGIRVSGPSI